GSVRHLLHTLDLADKAGMTAATIAPAILEKSIGWQALPVRIHGMQITHVQAHPLGKVLGLDHGISVSTQGLSSLGSGNIGRRKHDVRHKVGKLTPRSTCWLMAQHQNLRK